MENGLGFAIACAAVDTAAYLLCNRAYWKGEAAPNLVAWGVWTYIAVLNAASYLVVSGDVVKTVVAFENMVMCAATFVLAVRRRPSGPLRVLPWEWGVGAIGFGAATAWAVFRDAFVANALVQFATAVSTVPVWVGQWKDPRREPLLPWMLWTGVYVGVFALVAARSRGDWRDFVYPAVYVFLHAAVVVLALRRWTRPANAPSPA